ncbi:hypothetical protein BST83_12945 [Polaribacter filamentus]|jgi:hypothetical protein|uniref:Uncharacterized protein n=1 Tax=Polaribacter filamentus TaxID=53483 RepID=A0A2S7KZ57_9FLAO|nr:hypothetical protein BST83_12945 [Polaribacter filamentus]
MIKANKKSFKLLLISIISLLLYFFIENSERINSAIVQIQNSHASRGFGYFILFNILKWFLVISGIISLIMYLKIIFTRTNS